MSKLIETVDLKKYFNVAKGVLHAVDGVSISIEEGKTLGVVGESGCGKSTLGNTVLELIPPTSGQILYQGNDITKYSKKEMKIIRQDMQMIFQDPYASLNSRMTVQDLIAEPLLINKTFKSKQETYRRVGELMDTVGLARRLTYSYPHELDGGRRQRIGVARAIALDPKFIVCDEPVSALDVSIQAQILNLLMDLQDEKGLTYMFITHDLSVVKHISNTICVMYLGRVVEIADSDALFAKPLHPYTKALLEAIPIPSLEGIDRQREIIKGEVTNPIDPEPICRFCNRCTKAKDICHQVEPELRELENGHKVACHLFDDWKEI